jgi:hypothetical protein
VNLSATLKFQSVSMPKEAFEKEHKHLVEVLRKGSKQEQLKEADDQEKELKGGGLSRLAARVSDRALRYRAAKVEIKGGTRCALCGSTKNLRRDHKDGEERNNAPSNMRWLCHACNISTGLARARRGTGRRIVQDR